MGSLKKIARDKHINKCKILNEYKLEPTSAALEILEMVWDENGKILPSMIQEAVHNIKLIQKRNERNKEKIIKQAINYLEKIGFKEDEDFSIIEGSRGKEKAIYLTLRLKGNKKVIQHFEQCGWKIDRRYKNGTGDPSCWDSEAFRMSYKYVMIVLKFMIMQ